MHDLRDVLGTLGLLLFALFGVKGSLAQSGPGIQFLNYFQYPPGPNQAGNLRQHVQGNS